MSSNKKTRPARRRSSFKLRITVWITLLIAVVSSLGIGGILITGSQIADSRLQNELISTVERNVDEIEYKNGILEIENDFAFFVDEVYCNVFDSSGRYIDGESRADKQRESQERRGRNIRDRRKQILLLRHPSRFQQIRIRNRRLFREDNQI